MRTFRICILCGACLVYLSMSASAEVRITLKNGRSFIADFCREEKGMFVCEMQGGSMEIARSEIAGIKDVTVRRSMHKDDAPEPESQTEEKKGAEKPAAEKTEASE